MKKGLTSLSVILSVFLGTTFIGGVNASRARAATWTVQAYTNIWFNNYSETNPVATIKLLTDGYGDYQSYLWVWSWFRQSHSGWNIYLMNCTTQQPNGVLVSTSASGTLPNCYQLHTWRNSSAQEFYGPTSSGCASAYAEMQYDGDDQANSTTEWCSA